MPRDLRNPVFKPSDENEPNVIEPDRKDKPDVVQSKAEIDMMIATANKFFRTSKTKKGMGQNVVDEFHFRWLKILKNTEKKYLDGVMFNFLK